ncbi:MAG: glycogen debranching enzyme, partial [Acidobacteriota bacterium]
IFLNGETIPNPNPRGEPTIDDSFYIMLNAHYEKLVFTLPSSEWGKQWVTELDTEVGWIDDARTHKAGGSLELQSRSLVVLRRES